MQTIGVVLTLTLGFDSELSKLCLCIILLQEMLFCFGLTLLITLIRNIFALVAFFAVS